MLEAFTIKGIACSSARSPRKALSRTLTSKARVRSTASCDVQMCTAQFTTTSGRNSAMRPANHARSRRSPRQAWLPAKASPSSGVRWKMANVCASSSRRHRRTARPSNPEAPSKSTRMSAPCAFDDRCERTRDVLHIGLRQVMVQGKADRPPQRFLGSAQVAGIQPPEYLLVVNRAVDDSGVHAVAVAKVLQHARGIDVAIDECTVLIEGRLSPRPIIDERDSRSTTQRVPIPGRPCSALAEVLLDVFKLGEDDCGPEFVEKPVIPKIDDLTGGRILAEQTHPLRVFDEFAVVAGHEP